MIKDRRQKATALQFVVARGWFPQLEIIVLPHVSTSRRSHPITDIDVLGSVPDEFFGFRNVLFDCKSGAKESPIRRALWVRGLMERVNGARGVCILNNKNVERDHRLAASDLGVSLFTEDEFISYAQAMGVDLPKVDSCLSDIDTWDTYFDIGERFRPLEAAVEFSRSGFWLCASTSEACRRSIASILEIRAELDPRKAEHMAIFGDLLSLFLHSLSRICLEIFSSFAHPQRRSDLSEALLYLLYGGRDTYELHNKLLKLALRNREENSQELTPPEWNRFVQLARNLLDAPGQALVAPLLAREVGWSHLTTRRDLNYAQALARRNPQAAKFCMLTAEYFSKATRVPPEFGDHYSEQFVRLQTDGLD